MHTILDHPAISGRYLFPQSRYIDEPFIVQVNGAELACYRRMVDPKAFTLVHFHGNGEAVADYVPWMADDLAALGLNSLFVEYRQYGRSTGDAHLASMLGDGEAVIVAAGMSPEKVIAFGRSIGSLYAVELVHRQPAIAGLILESGIADASDRFLDRVDLSGTGVTVPDAITEMKRAFNQERKLSGYRNPVLVLHAQHDRLLDISHAEWNHRWAGSSQKHLVRLPFGDHNSIMEANRDAYFDALSQFVKVVTHR
jgi:alpha-beta hydrolase superfamily lysophospholipase